MDGEAGFEAKETEVVAATEADAGRRSAGLCAQVAAIVVPDVGEGGGFFLKGKAIFFGGALEAAVPLGVVGDPAALLVAGATVRDKSRAAGLGAPCGALLVAGC